jgi:hypothetical protein
MTSKQRENQCRRVHTPKNSLMRHNTYSWALSARYRQFINALSIKTNRVQNRLQGRILDLKANGFGLAKP